MDIPSDIPNSPASAPGSAPGSGPGRPLPGPRRPAHAAPSTGTSRRWFLAGGSAVVLAAGAGVGADFLRDKDPTHKQSAPPPPPPADLVAAIETERELIADLDATTGGSAAVRQVIKQARVDHAAHLRALTPLLAKYRTPTPTATTPSTRSRGRPRSAAQLRAAEDGASAAAARRAAGFDGGLAALLASIAACEATHAELLT